MKKKKKMEGGGVRGRKVLGEPEKEKIGEDEGVNFSAAGGHSERTRPRLAPHPFTPLSPCSARLFRWRPRGRWHRGATRDSA